MSAALTVALLQIEAAGYDQDENLRRGEAACRRAAALGADLALFPEMWNIGYGFEGERQGRGGRAAAGRARPLARAGGHRRRPLRRPFAHLANELGLAIAVTYLEATAGGPRNTVSLVDRHGREALRYAKVHTCAFDWPEAALVAGDGLPVATLDTAAGPVRVGAMICFDRELPETARVLALDGAELLLVPNACPMEDNRTGQLRARAFENMVAVALANYPATHADCDGHSVAFHPCAWDAAGRGRDTTVVRAGPDEAVVLAAFDLDELRAWRRAEVLGGAFRRPALYGRLVDPAVAEPFRRRDAAGRPFSP